MDSELRERARQFARWLRRLGGNEWGRLGTVVEQLCAAEAAPTAEQAPAAAKPSPQPAPAGNPLVLRELKCWLGVAGADPEPVKVQVGPDRFQMPAASPLRSQHETLTELLREAAESPDFQSPSLPALSAGQAILALDPVARGRVLLAAAERHIAALLAPTRDYNDPPFWRSQWATTSMARDLVSSAVQLDRDGLFDLLLYLSTRPARATMAEDAGQALFASIGAAASTGTGLAEGERYVLHRWRASRIGGPPLGAMSHDTEQLTEWIGDGSRFFLVPGERWSDAMNADIAQLPAVQRAPWAAFLKHMLGATSARPSDKWRKTAIKLAEGLGEGKLRESLVRWLPLVAKGRSLPAFPVHLGDTRTAGDSIQDENATSLRGMLWLIPSLSGREEMARLAASVALTAYKKIPGVGPRAVKVGNAAVYALSEMVSPASIGQLAMLKVRIPFGTAQKEIEKAFDAAAAALELPRDQIEEMSVPSCGLETVGRREETIGEYRAELTVSASDAHLLWFDPRGKLLKAAPASVKKDGADILKELQQGAKDLQAMLSAQRDRIDALFLERKSWPEPVWRERYLDHPLVGTIARRLIWSVAETPVIATDGRAFDVRGNRFDIPEGALVTLWHPAGQSVDEVIAWRRRIEELGIVQPFKQAHREIYLLTDAERRTQTYSNRFAAHILRQHQFNALCAIRRWKNKLRLMVDDRYPPATRDLPAWGLRAEFWIEGIGEDYGSDTNDSGVFHRLASDQVRFYRQEAAPNTAHAGGGGYQTNAPGPGPGDINEPLPLESVPRLAFSEILRDVDLFVGVASIGNDPAWRDGGPEGRYSAYCRSYSCGELSETGVSRREALERLVPRLKIAPRCTLSERFLTVRGDRRTYKIHLGSGNILMEPNDQYLCIVPDARARLNDAPVYLPFEGDATLSIILSKALLLSEDSKIADPTIKRQIDGR
jgi:hypothetical protein